MSEPKADCRPLHLNRTATIQDDGRQWRQVLKQQGEILIEPLDLLWILFDPNQAPLTSDARWISYKLIPSLLEYTNLQSIERVYLRLLSYMRRTKDMEMFSILAQLFVAIINCKHLKKFRQCTCAQCRPRRFILGLRHGNVLLTLLYLEISAPLPYAAIAVMPIVLSSVTNAGVLYKLWLRVPDEHRAALVGHFLRAAAWRKLGVLEYILPKHITKFSQFLQTVLLEVDRFDLQAALDKCKEQKLMDDEIRVSTLLYTAEEEAAWLALAV